ncbi:MAG: PQQ-like beta-propeller repeat protein, partial [Candidatus Coatesbacteria bacterium]|nr:PQQ-like beta-propeller repeat protein [Candidatus Coatesbacteria bacterium]
ITIINSLSPKKGQEMAAPRNIVIFTILALIITGLASLGPAQTTHTFCPQFRYDAHHTGYSEQVGPSELNLAMELDIPPVGGFIEGFFATPSFDKNGNLYAGSMDNYFYSVSPLGSLRWSYQTTGIVGTGGSPLITSNERLIFGNDNGKLYCLDLDGGFIWSYSTTGGDAAAIFNGPSSSFDGNVYFGDNAGVLYSLRESDGSVNWSIQLTAESIYTSSVTIDGDMLYVGATDGYLYAISKAGVPTWSYNAGGEIHATPVLTDDGDLLFGSTNGSFTCVDRQGLLQWSDTFEGPVTASAAYAGEDSVVVGDENAAIRKYRTDGSLVWSGALVGAIKASPVIDSDGKIYVYSEPGNIYIMGSDGYVLDWTTRDGYWKAGSSPVIGPDGTLYICTGKDMSQVLGFRAPGSGLPSIDGFAEDADVTIGESLKYSVSFSNPSRRLTVDFYVAVAFGNSLLFYPNWTTDWNYTRLTLDAGASGTVTLVDIPIADGSLAADYTFYAAPMVPNTLINFTNTSVANVTVH